VVAADPFRLGHSGAAKEITSAFPAAKPGTQALGNGSLHAYVGHELDFAQLTGVSPTLRNRSWRKWRAGAYPDIPLRFKATARKGPHWAVFHLGTKWKSQTLRVIKPQAAVLSRQAADFGSLYCLTYAVPGQAVLVREYAFIPMPERADPDWVFYLKLDARPDAFDATHASYANGKQTLRLQFPGWNHLDGRGTTLDDSEIRGWTSEAANDGGVVWRTAVAYTLLSRGSLPTELDLSPEGLAGLRVAALGD
jgi:hypothetical protein